jgi:DhnA family fructose-bisphosphate aldolase class Ia
MLACNAARSHILRLSADSEQRHLQEKSIIQKRGRRYDMTTVFMAIESNNNQLKNRYKNDD